MEVHVSSAGPPLLSPGATYGRVLTVRLQAGINFEPRWSDVDKRLQLISDDHGHRHGRCLFLLFLLGALAPATGMIRSSARTSSSAAGGLERLPFQTPISSRRQPK